MIAQGRRRNVCMSFSDTKFCMPGSTRTIVHPGVSLFSMLLLTGCSTVVTYNANLPAGPARKPGYPIPVYTEDMTVPRPCELIGTISVRGGHFTMFGGSAESGNEKGYANRPEERRRRRQMQIDRGRRIFQMPNYRMVADLLRYADTWETIAISDAEFHQLSRHHTDRTSTRLKGVWEATGTNPHRIGIIRDHSQPGRDFSGLFSTRKIRPGTKATRKLTSNADLNPAVTSWIITSTISAKRKPPSFWDKVRGSRWHIPTTDEEADIITYTREQPVNRFEPFND